MPAALDVDREAVRTLVVAVGVREAARQMGIPAATVQAWSARGKWFDQKRSVQAIATERKSVQPSAIKPADALANVLEARKSKTRLHLSKYVVNASHVASRSRSPLADAPNVRAVASVMQTLWPEQQVAGVQISVLAAGGMMQ